MVRSFAPGGSISIAIQHRPAKVQVPMKRPLCLILHPLLTYNTKRNAKRAVAARLA